MALLVVVDRASRAVARARQPAEQLGQLRDLFLTEMLEEGVADALGMGAARFDKSLIAGLGELGVGHPQVAGAGDALEQVDAAEAVDEPGHPGAGEHRALGELRHGESALRLLGEEEQNFVIPGSETVAGDKISVKLARDRRMAEEKPSPSVQCDPIESCCCLGAHNESLVDESTVWPP